MARNGRLLRYRLDPAHFRHFGRPLLSRIAAADLPESAHEGQDVDDDR